MPPACGCSPCGGMRQKELSGDPWGASVALDTAVMRLAFLRVYSSQRFLIVIVDVNHTPSKFESHLAPRMCQI